MLKFVKYGDKITLTREMLGDCEPPPIPQAVIEKYHQRIFDHIALKISIPCGYGRGSTSVDAFNYSGPSVPIKLLS